MNAIVNHLGFSSIEAKGIELEEEVISHNISISYDYVHQSIYTKKFGTMNYDYLMCLPLEIKIVDYNLIENSKNLIEYIACSLNVQNPDNNFTNYAVIRISSNYLSGATHNFVLNMNIKITYLVLPQELQIKNYSGQISCSSNRITF